MNEHAVLAIATMLAVGALVLILLHHATTTQKIVGALGTAPGYKIALKCKRTFGVTIVDIHPLPNVNATNGPSD